MYNSNATSTATAWRAGRSSETALTALFLDTGFDPLHHVQFTWWDSLLYYYYYLQHVYSDYAFVVRFSYFMTVLSVLSIFSMTVLMVIIFIRRKRAQRYQHYLRGKWWDKAVEIIECERELSLDEVAEITGNAVDGIYKRWQRREHLAMLSEIFAEVRARRRGAAANKPLYHNLRMLMEYTGIREYMEVTLREGMGVDKMLLMQMAQQFHLSITESTLSRFFDTENVALRKVTRFYYMYRSKEDPFRFLEQGGDDHYVQLDNLWTHRILEMRSRGKKSIPPLSPYIERAKDERFRALLIRETGWWGTDKDMEHITKYLTCDSDLCRQASIEALGRKRYKGAEDRLQACYQLQTEQIRRTVLYALLNIGSGHSLDFIANVCRTTTSDATAREALHCLWHYNARARQLFLTFKEKAGEKYYHDFDYIASPNYFSRNDFGHNTRIETQK